MKMKRKTLAVLLVAGLLLVTSASAWYLIWHQAVKDCSDTDGGANYMEKGEITVEIFKTGRIEKYPDYCINNYTVAEYVCSDDVTGRPCDHANMVVQNCKLALGNPTAACIDGMCVN